MPTSECFIKIGDTPIGLDVLGVYDWLMSQFHFVSMTDTDEILYYYNGVYHSNGEKVINKVLENAFGRLRDMKNKLILTGRFKSQIRNKIRDNNYMDRSKFDSDKHIINMKNGLFNWKTMELSPHTPNYKSIIQIPVEYDPSADCPNIKRSFSAVFEETDLIKFREFIAYCLYNGYPIQKAFILYSPGDTGKSFVMNIVRQFLGVEHCTDVSIHKLTTNRFAGFNLVGKLLNSCGDLDNKALSSLDEFKKATSGLDPINCEEKGKTSFEYVNTAKFLFGANRLNKTNDASVGFFRRIEIIHTKKKLIKKGLPTIDEVTTPNELSGLFNWVIGYLEPLLERKHFKYESQLDEIKHTYIAASDPISSFISSRLVEKPGMRVVKDDVYEAFLKYCEDNNVFEIPDKTTFWREVWKVLPRLQEGEKVVAGKRKNCIRGYDLVNEGYENI